VIFLKFTASQWIYGGEKLEEVLERISRYRYYGIEIIGDLERKDEMKELLQSYDLKPTAVDPAHFAYTPELDLMSNDEKIRRKVIQYTKNASEMMAELGGDMFIIVPSAVGKIEPLASPEKEWSWAVESIKEIAEYGQEVGVRYPIEPLNRFETYFINNVDQAKKLMEDINMDNVGILLDNFHMNIEEVSSIEAIKKTGSKLLDFHIADSNRMPPGMGHTDWKGILNALKEIGYDEYLNMEFLTPIDRSPLSKMKEREVKVDEGLKKYLVLHGTGALSKEYYDEVTEHSIKYLKSKL